MVNLDLALDPSHLSTHFVSGVGCTFYPKSVVATIRALFPDHRSSEPDLVLQTLMVPHAIEERSSYDKGAFSM